MPFDFLVQLRGAYLIAWVVCFAGFGRLIAERPSSVDKILPLVIVSVAFATIATVTLLAVRIERWRSLVLRDSGSLDEAKPGLLLLTTLAYALCMYGAVYAFELGSRG